MLLPPELSFFRGKDSSLAFPGSSLAGGFEVKTFFAVVEMLVVVEERLVFLP